MAKHSLTREVEGTTYKAEGEVLPSGRVVFVFDTPLPGRTKVLSVDEDAVAELLVSFYCEPEYDHEQGHMMLTLFMVHEQAINDMEDAPSPEYKAATAVVDANVILEMVLDQMVDPCPHCGKFQYGDDVIPEDETGNDKPKKTYLN